ncbi:hypothetical protein HPP92_004120 [Vanilla planifolia]|uniref:Uncharacterized protein n=1 Tax=Vanilla planifolia TaxID=51239 RepID=A0A835RWB4_VANPL|nr:hypothetical protein HPP92_004120 [Vanilla planifolia]
MTGGRRKRRKTTIEGTDSGSGVLEKTESPSRSSHELCFDVPTLGPGVDLYAQARKALTERCPFDGEEAASRVGTLPYVLAANLQRQFDGRRKHRKVQEGAGVKAIGPGRLSAVRSIWEETEDYFRPMTLDDIDLLVPQLPSASFFYIPSSENVEGKEAVSGGRPSRQMDLSSSSEVVKELTLNTKVEAALVVETDSELTCSSAWPVRDSVAGGEKSLNWILGCKQRFILSAERPSKKAKLIGGDSGLEQLMLLPRGEAAAEAASPSCDFCCLGVSDINSGRLLFCESCKVSVHQKCYGVHESPAGGWMCSWCKHLDAVIIKSEGCGVDDDSRLKPCLLCPKAGGALKPVADDEQGNEDKKYVHLFCSLWTPEMYVEDVGAMEPIMNIFGIQDTRKRMMCSLCKVKCGVCLRCCHGKCRTAFHPVCAREAKHQMEIWGKFAQDNHSSVRHIDGIPSTERSIHSASNDLSVGKPLPSSLPVKRLPKIRISRKIKDKSMSLDTAISASHEVSKNGTRVDQESSALKLRPEEGVTQSNQMADSVHPDSENGLPNASDIIKIFQKIIVRRKINLDDVALELGVSSASLESAMADDGTLCPSDLRNGSTESSDDLITSAEGKSASLLRGSNAQCTIKQPVVRDHLVKSQRPHRTKKHKHNSGDDNALSLTNEALYQDRTRELVGEVADVRTSLANSMLTDTNVCVPSSHIEEEHSASETILEHRVAFPDLGTSEYLLPEDNPEGSMLKEASNCSRLTLESDQIFEAKVNDLKSDNVVDAEYDPCVSGCPMVKDVGSYSGSYVHPFILKKLTELQSQWHLPQKYGKVEAVSNDHGSVSDPLEFDRLAKTKCVKTLELLPADEVEGELLYLQNCLLNRACAIKLSCEELFHRLVHHLPEALESFRKKRWDMVLVNQYLSEVKEAKKRGRKERKHKEAQAILAAATAAAAASRNSLLRKDAVEGVSSIHQQQNLLKFSTTSERATLHSLPALRIKEASSRSYIPKMSLDKHSGNFKLPDFAKENVLFCDICWRKETMVNRIFICSICKVAVHLDCYRRLKDPTGPWRCELCEDMSIQCASPRTQRLGSSEKHHSRAHCSLCGGVTGAFRKSVDGEWVHAFCAEWLLESVYKRGQQNLVEGMGSILKEKDSSTCCICHYRLGLCLKCSYGHCQTTFHPTCARSAGLFMNIKTTGGRLQHKAYCDKHSAEQREKADCLLGVEELKHLKQVRVELEKVRLLCERIIKREKVKRELLICSHGIISLRRNCIVSSNRAYSSFAPGVSSESATTSIDNRSYSGAIQRSDDITVDSTISGKRKYHLPLDFDPRTDDSSTSQLSFKRKISDRTVFSGKRLPQRPASGSRNSTYGGEKRSKPQKDLDGLRKEKMMTYCQASLQNQRLPKGFIYVPCGSLKKDNLAAHDQRSCDLHESDGLT